MKRTIRACASLFRISLAESLQYRLAALSGVVTSLLWGFVEVALLTVFYRYSSTAGAANGLTLAQATSHIWIREVLLVLLPYGIDGELLNKINNGDIALEVCRPLDLYWHWFARSAAGKVASFLMRGLVCFAVAFLIPYGYGAKLPVSIEAFLAFVPSLLCAFVLGESYLMLVTALRTNISWGDGPMHLMLFMSSVLSGGVLPLQLWPDSLQTFLVLQPFAGICDIPARLYMGSMPVSEALFGMGIQLMWAMVFIAAGRAVMASKLRTIVAQGG